MRSLIREVIERHGYRDATCYPVQQQPRRGRPPKSTELTDQAEQLETVDGHPIPDQIAALVEPKTELLMVRASDESRDEDVDVPRESEVSDDSDNTAAAETGSANENTIEDMLGALR